jgi:hypothetical protein
MGMVVFHSTPAACSRCSSSALLAAILFGSSASLDSLLRFTFINGQLYFPPQFAKGKSLRRSLRLAFGSADIHVTKRESWTEK